MEFELWQPWLKRLVIAIHHQHCLFDSYPRCEEVLLRRFDEKRSYSGSQMCKIMSKAFKGHAADFVLDFKLNN